MSGHPARLWRPSWDSNQGKEQLGYSELMRGAHCTCKVATAEYRWVESVKVIYFPQSELIQVNIQLMEGEWQAGSTYFCRVQKLGDRIQALERFVRFINTTINEQTIWWILGGWSHTSVLQSLITVKSQWLEIGLESSHRTKTRTFILGSFHVVYMPFQYLLDRKSSSLTIY